MHTLPNNAWWPDALKNRGNGIGSSITIALPQNDTSDLESRASRPTSREVSDDHFPFDALIRLVRIMRQ